MSAGNQNLGLWKNSVISKLLSHFSNPTHLNFTNEKIKALELVSNWPNKIIAPKISGGIRLSSPRSKFLSLLHTFFLTIRKYFQVKILLSSNTSVTSALKFVHYDRKLNNSINLSEQHIRLNYVLNKFGFIRS